MKLPWNTLAILVLLILALLLAGRARRENLHTEKIRAVAMDPGDSPNFILLKGEPETQSLRSGIVTLAPGKALGVYSTGSSEEMLVPLEGQGEIRFAEHEPLAMKPGLIAYAPAHTQHDVVNTGNSRLRYLFVTAKTE